MGPLKLLNSRGEPIVLNDREQATIDDPMLRAQYETGLRRLGLTKNALGYDIVITSLTTIAKKITEQKFFEIAPADYVPVRVGEGAWSDQIVTYREFMLGTTVPNFAAGIINTGANNSRVAQADTGVDSVPVPVKNFAMGLGWSIFDLEQAAKSGNWDIVTAKERSRKKVWDLGIQSIAFNGLPTSGLYGLLTQNLNPQQGADVTVNTTLLTNSISSLAATPSTLSAFLQQILNVYRINTRYSAWPTHFIIPESDYLGLATPSSPTFPLKSILQLMQETLQTMTGNKNFKVLPCRYADGNSEAPAVAGTQVYTLTNYAEESIRMDIPVDYTNTLANSIDNFSFQNVGYGQFTGVQVYRGRELMYFQFPTSNLS